MVSLALAALSRASGRSGIFVAVLWWRRFVRSAGEEINEGRLLGIQIFSHPLNMQIVLAICKLDKTADATG